MLQEQADVSIFCVLSLPMFVVYCFGFLRQINTGDGTPPRRAGTGIPTASSAFDTSYYASFVDSDSYSACSSATVSVPEPTSGLLLALGMAGLALRRKMA